MSVMHLHRTLEQELQALLRCVSLECLVCGEFVLRLPTGELFCPECGSGLGEPVTEPAAGVSSLSPSG